MMDDEPMPVQKWWQPDVTYQLKVQQWEERQAQRRRLREFLDPGMPYAATYGTLVGAQGHMEEQGQVDAALRMDHMELRDDEGSVVIADGVDIRATGAVSERVSGKGLLQGTAEGEGAPARKSKKRSLKRGELAAKGQGTLNASGKAALNVSAHADRVTMTDSRGRSAEATGVDLDLRLAKSGHLQGELIRVLETELHTVKATHFDLPPAAEPAKALSSTAIASKKPAAVAVAAAWEAQPVASAGENAVTTEHAVPHLPSVIEKQSEVASLTSPLGGMKLADDPVAQARLDQVVQQVMRCVAVMLQPFHMGGTRGTLEWRRSDKANADKANASGSSFTVSSRPFTVHLLPEEDQAEGDARIERSNNKVRASVFRTICSVTSTLESLDAFLLDTGTFARYGEMIRDRLRELQKATNESGSKQNNALLCDLLADMCKERFSVASMNAAMFVGSSPDNMLTPDRDGQSAVSPDDLQHGRTQTLVLRIGKDTRGIQWDDVPALEILKEHKSLIANKGARFSEYLTSTGLVLLAGLCAHPPLNEHGEWPKGMAKAFASEMQFDENDFNTPDVRFIGSHPFWGRLGLGGLTGGKTVAQAEKEFVIKAWKDVKKDVAKCHVEHLKFYTEDVEGFGAQPVIDPVSAPFPDVNVDTCTSEEKDAYKRSPTSESSLAKQLGLITNTHDAFEIVHKDLIECRVALWDSLDTLAATNPKVGRYASIPHWKAGYLFTFSKMLAQNLTGHALKPRVSDFEKIRFRMLVDLRARMEQENPAPPSHVPRFSTVPNPRTGAVTRSAQRIGDVIFYAKQAPAHAGPRVLLSAKEVTKKHTRAMQIYTTLWRCALQGTLSTGLENEVLLVPLNESGIDDVGIEVKMEKRMKELRDTPENQLALNGMYDDMQACKTPDKSDLQRDLQRKFNRLFTDGRFPMPLTGTERALCVTAAERLQNQCSEELAAIEQGNFTDADKETAQAAYKELVNVVNRQRNARSRDDLYGKVHRQARGDLPEQMEAKGLIKEAQDHAKTIHDIRGRDANHDAEMDVEEKEPDPSFRPYFVAPRQHGLTDDDRKELRALQKAVKDEMSEALYHTMAEHNWVWPDPDLPEDDEHKRVPENVVEELIGDAVRRFDNQANAKVDNWMRGMPKAAQNSAKDEVWRMSHEINTDLRKNYFG